MLSKERKGELQHMIHQMQHASAQFYAHATRIGCHPFIEFTGLMNEYIKACEGALKQGIDFTLCNTHTGQHLPMAGFMVKYVNEKLECIYTGRAALRDKAEA